MSLVDRRETLLVRGDLVRFQLVEVPVGVANGGYNGKAEFLRSDSSSGAPTKKKWAYRVAPFRKFIHARIESLNEMVSRLCFVFGDLLNEINEVPESRPWGSARFPHLTGIVESDTQF